jgi:hypothetical protein
LITTHILKIASYSLLLFVLIIGFSCDKKIKMYKIDDKMDFPIFHHPWLLQDTIEIEIGLNNVVRRTFNHNVLIGKDSCLLCLNAFISNDTVKLFYENPDCFIEYELFHGQYIVNVTYITDIMGTYPEDKKYQGTTQHLALKYDKLVLKQDKLNFGDTLQGYFELETMPYHHFKEYQIDKISGSFIAKIKDITTKVPYFIP